MILLAMRGIPTPSPIAKELFVVELLQPILETPLLTTATELTGNPAIDGVPTIVVVSVEAAAVTED